MKQRTWSSGYFPIAGWLLVVEGNCNRSQYFITLAGLCNSSIGPADCNIPPSLEFCTSQAVLSLWFPVGAIPVVRVEFSESLFFHGEDLTLLKEKL